MTASSASLLSSLSLPSGHIGEGGERHGAMNRKRFADKDRTCRLNMGPSRQPERQMSAG